MYVAHKATGSHGTICGKDVSLGLAHSQSALSKDAFIDWAFFQSESNVYLSGHGKPSCVQQSEKTPTCPEKAIANFVVTVSDQHILDFWEACERSIILRM